MTRVLNICVTGAGGNIAYSLYGFLLNTQIFGENASISLRLLDIQQKVNKLRALKVELEDCCYPVLKQILVCTKQSEAFKEADLVIFLGAMSRKPGMQRIEVFQINAKIFQEQGKKLDSYAKKTCKSLVVANPPNTNCMVLALNAPSIPKENFTCLTRLDYNRLISQISHTLQIDNKLIKNAIVWGNHSRNQFHDLTRLEIQGLSPEEVLKEIEKINYLQLAKNIADRGIFIVDNIIGGSFISAAKAIVDHLKDWLNGNQKMAVMGVLLQEVVYGIPTQLCFSFPTICLGGGKYEIVGNLNLNEEQKKRIQDCREELLKEKLIVSEFIEGNKIQ